MPLPLTIERLKTIYENKTDKLYCDKLMLIMNMINEFDILAFYCSLLFHDQDISEQFSVSSRCILLYESPKIVNYLIDKTFGIKIETQLICDKLKKDSNSYFECFNLLLILERKFDQIIDIDYSFIKSLFKKLNTTQQKVLFGHELSPILINLMMDDQNFNDNFIDFCRAEKITSKNERMLKCNELDYLEIKEVIIESNYEYINNKLSFYYEVYPELLRSDRLFDSFLRIKYLLNPLDIPIDEKLLKTFVPVVNENDFKEIFPELDVDKNIQLYFYYIQKILLEETEILKLINDWLIEHRELFKVILIKKPSITNLKMFIEMVPVTKFFYKEIFTFLKETGEQYYYDLFYMIVTKYPSKKNITLIKNNQFILSSNQLENLKYLFNYVKNK